MSAAVDYAEAHDVIVVAAAGNDGTPGDPELNWWSWPAAYTWPIAVASIDQWHDHSTFSTQASYVDVAAPGTSIVSTAPTHATVAWPSGTPGYGGMSGTSMATPYVVALAAILRGAHPTETAAQIRARIVDTADDLGSTGWDSSFGNGLIDPPAALAG
jgi:subtilisin family serine protease